mmetsp:Transcript_1130/g.2527  ORF Transcript_1130/g.2527 Transcript_1130/m.2527 type:complete len:306 (+) Transcript_1130:69-986(+)
MSPAGNRLVPPQCLFVFIDLEATGLDVSTDDIIEIGALCCLWKDGEWCEWSPAPFQQYVATSRKLDPFIVKLTGITNVKLDSCGIPVERAFSLLVQWLEDCRAKAPRNVGELCPTWLVAHNGLCFDFPMLASVDKQIADSRRFFPQRPLSLFRRLGVSGVVDTLRVSRQLGGSRGHSLSKLHRVYARGSTVTFHSAVGDCEALAAVAASPKFSRAWATERIGLALDKIQILGRVSTPQETACRQPEVPPRTASRAPVKVAAQQAAVPPVSPAPAPFFWRAFCCRRRKQAWLASESLQGSTQYGTS